VWQKTQVITFLGLGLALAPMAHSLTLDLPAPILSEETRSEVPGSYDLPIGPFAGGTVPTRTVEGVVTQRALQLDAPGQTTLALLAPLREQIVAAGFEVLLECEARVCGGFDFRYGTEVVPEPDMHVDLGDFRFLSATRGDEAVSILVSRSALSGYVQITRVTAAPEGVTIPDAPVPPAIDLDLVIERDAGDLTLPDAQIGPALDQVGTAVLGDLDFASGAATLSGDEYPSLAAVAAWLEANPDGTIALVGHTDASGSLAANIAVSERRAEAVAQVLVDRYGVDRDRVTAKGVGFLAPRATNQTEEGRQKNRRVEVVVTSTR
jgi:outer membrane protein OmpA-like peptidoglycan-associated protein